ncbi:MAG: DUF1993 domain-containing protein [Polyangiaceae bacterium]
MNLHKLVVQQPAKMLRNVQAWLRKAQSYAEERKFDVNNLLSARLAPDQYPLVRQIQTACDGAKLNAARLSGKEPPVHPDTETTVEQLMARVDSVVAFLETIGPSDFEGALDRKITTNWMQGKHMVGGDYLCEFVVPNFYFHISHIYALLRHNGVPLGKFDYIGGANLKD